MQENDSKQTAGSDRVGLAAASVRDAVHDLRGALNTLSIVHELLRLSPAASEPPQRDALQSAVRAVRDLDAMLQRLRTASDTMTYRADPVPLAAALHDAVERRSQRGIEDARSHGTRPNDLMIPSCFERLPRALDLLLECARDATSPDGALTQRGTAAGLTIEAFRDGDLVAIAVRCPSQARAIGPSLARLTPSPPTNGADWFLLHCLARGLGGSLHSAGESSLDLRLLLPLSTTACPP